MPPMKPVCDADRQLAIDPQTGSQLSHKAGEEEERMDRHGARWMELRFSHHSAPEDGRTPTDTVISMFAVTEEAMGIISGSYSGPKLISRVHRDGEERPITNAAVA
ncbi:unnamed protein product [Pleuronectes platessa]|uniref:Uncharacterized protein n=1 Tax=Pleuronectes platessa TaxID=8262 RepID=A0A9N7YKS2_PLEPL|nr:unnamed protein product [Pleuronectes platessa]